MMLENECATDEIEDNDCWNILVVDDDNFIHVMIKEIMKDFTFEGKTINILDAYTGSDALKILSKNKNIALVMLDVYIGDETTGLQLTKYIREMAGNSVVRIVLMTGAGNSKLQEDAILNYDINGYEEKTELISKKLHTVVASSLRSYRDIMHINNNKKAMEQVAASYSKLFEADSMKQFLSSTFCHLSSIINLCREEEGCNVSGIVAIKTFDKKCFSIISGFGKYENIIDDEEMISLVEKDLKLIEETCEDRNYIKIDNRYVACYSSSSGVEGIIFFETKHEKMDHVDSEVLDIFHKNITTSFENLCINKEIEETQKEILYILGEVTEVRSEETGKHVERVSKYAKILAEEYGLSKRDTMLVTMAAPIHDVGKIAVPDNILLKPGKLTREEFEVVKTHTTIGYNILKSSNRDVLKSAAIIAHEHHEHYDGKGYPQGLKGEEIHIFGRIAAIADVFDALGSPRVYKKAWILNDILNHFKEQKGKHFDPDLVDILFDNLNKFLEIKDKFSDKNIKDIGQVSDNNSRK